MLYNGRLFAFGSVGVSWKYIFSGNVLGMSKIKNGRQLII